MECIAAALAAARHGSFSAAADELGVTHATVSRRVAGAERWAGVRLFDRHGRGVRPTHPGQFVLNRLAVALDEVNAVVDRERTPRQRPAVRLSVTPSFARFWLWPRLSALEGEDLHIDVVAELRNADLEGGEVDMAIRYGRGGWKFDHEEPLFDEFLAPFAARAAFPMLATADPEEIVQLPLLHNGPTRGWPAWGLRHNVRVRRKAADRQVGDTGLMMDAALAGLGVGLWLTALRPAPEAARLLLFRSDLRVPAPHRYHLLMRTPRPGGPAAVLAERIRKAAAACMSGKRI
jgi:DNA-binding transcriptional LysR family regulator